MSMPLTEERLQKIEEDVMKFLESFGIEFTKYYGTAVVTAAEKEVEVYEDLRKLKYRDFGSVPRTSFKSGYVFLKEGEGPGSFSDKWRMVYIVETEDYNLAIYNSEEDFKNKKDKPKQKISLAGYKLTKEPRKDYEKVAKELAMALELGDDGIPISFSPFSWALTHDNRDNYVMQMHEGAKPGFCSCIRGPTVEPEDIGRDEYKTDGEKWIKTFDRCVKRVKARDLKSLSGQAFDMAVKRVVLTNPQLKGFQTDGTEGEILMDLLVELTLKPVLKEICGEIGGPATIRIAIYYKMRSMAFKVLHKAIEEVWAAIQKKSNALGDELKNKIKQLLSKIASHKEDGKDKIRELVVDKISKKLNEFVKPAVNPVFNVFDDPLTSGLTKIRKLLEDEITKLEKLNNVELNAIPRNKKTMADVKKLTDALIKPLEELKKQFPILFEHVEVKNLKQSMQDVLFTTADAVINTIEIRYKENENVEKQQLLKSVLKEFDDDAKIVKAQYLVSIMQLVFVGGFKRIVQPIVGNLLGDLSSAIPAEIEKFVNINSLYDEFIELFVSEPIISVVYAIYPEAKPKRKHENEEEPELEQI